MQKVTVSDCNAWLKANRPKSVAIVCMDGYGDVEMAKAIKSHDSGVNVHLFEPGNYQEEEGGFDFVLFGHDPADRKLSMLGYGEFLARCSNLA